MDSVKCLDIYVFVARHLVKGKLTNTVLVPVVQWYVWSLTRHQGAYRWVTYGCNSYLAKYTNHRHKGAHWYDATSTTRRNIEDRNGYM